MVEANVIVVVTQDSKLALLLKLVLGRPTSTMQQLSDVLTRQDAKGLQFLTLENFPGTGRGVKTLRPLRTGEQLLTIPSTALLTTAAASVHPLLGPVLHELDPPLSDEEALAVFLLFIKSRESENEMWKFYMEVLPVQHTNSIFFNNDELEVCAGSSLYGITKQLKQQVDDDYAQIESRLFAKHSNIFPKGGFTIKKYIWALCIVWSRAMDFDLPGNRPLRLIAPFADMLNHSHEVTTCHTYHIETGAVSIVASRDYNTGDQVFINYGQVPNNRLLRLYGFVLPSNPYDSYELMLFTSNKATLFTQKVALLAAAGLNTISTISLTLMDPLPNKVLQYLRIQRLDQMELMAVTTGVADTDTLVTVRNEGEIQRALLEALEGLLEGFSTNDDVLEQRINRGEYMPGGNLWAAAIVSMGEQRVLKSAIERVKLLRITTL